jgi:TetR/AcrR family transcriptional regulator
VATLRMPAEKRRSQIVQVALKTIDKYGIQGTTMGRIAKGAGVTQSALYVHFRSRDEIFSAALDAIYAEIFDIQEVARTDNVLEGLREATQTAYARFIRGHRGRGHSHLLLEFATSSRKRGLREMLKQKQMAATKQLAGIIEEGKRQGSISEDTDSERLAWMLTGWSWVLDVAQLMGVGTSWYPSVSTELLDAILDSATALGRPPVADDPAPCSSDPLPTG